MDLWWQSAANARAGSPPAVRHLLDPQIEFGKVDNIDASGRFANSSLNLAATIPRKPVAIKR